MITKSCIVCKKEFKCNNPNYILCSPECRKIHQKEYMHAYINKNREYYTQQKRIWYKHNCMATVACKICRQVIPASINNVGRITHKYYHEACVLEDATSAIKEGKSGKDSRIRRAVNLYSYSISELKELCDL